MNKINILAVMSLGVLFSAPMYADDPVPAPQEHAPSESNAIKMLPESKGTLEDQAKRKVLLEERNAKIIEQYNQKLPKMIKIVSKDGKKKFAEGVSSEINKMTDLAAKKLSKNQKFRENSDKLSEEKIDNALASTILEKAKAKMKEDDAKMSEKFQNLTL